ncbi:uncharacterized protein PODANS_3_7610 [Podospora anserina S mat+]|uniref:Podospora anserina S mat+ genomic DNA chromosome 3, supercontig 2 n=1 Tax=Podospora anserina (strain S / ATCC MYA-4624 / DSM 980 / FGSC 10383) TaxID=515849 RepID=B2B0X2_PODAN|nr:uncharacterized protein PODANS_3_7610 [Podospora anserina S mat+]CAP70697.1 unnamed protein product [Podospora anserina S mat+]CDP27288.1 Putative protein of unknown function [Podospora anserina S mat+]
MSVVSSLPVDETQDLMSVDSSPAIHHLEDEIVVGTKANRKLPVNQDKSDIADVNMDPSAILTGKRKRTSTYYADSVQEDSPGPHEGRVKARPAKTHGSGGVKGVIIGYWRDSEVENEADKHSVIGFIDSRDRLRTRIQTTTRDKRQVDQRYPIPPGPGGSWVIFEKIVFEDHLVGLNHHMIKEFVKIRADNLGENESPEERNIADKAAAELAVERVTTNPPPETANQPLIAYGAVIPDPATLPSRPESKKRKVTGSFTSAQLEPAPPPQQPAEALPGTRPTRIVLGYWKQSSEDDPIEKHAVYGILGANDMFRIRLAKETRDGRVIADGNFPSGPGALWITWDALEFEPHLKGLSRHEVKEYCRVRQHQLDQGEAPEDRTRNEIQAVQEAQKRAALNIAAGTSITKNDVEISIEGANGVTHGLASGSPASKTNEPRRQTGLRGRHSLPNPEFGVANRKSSSAIAQIERTHELARHGIEKVEKAQARIDQRASSTATPRESSATPANRRELFSENISRLNNVWASQEATRIRNEGQGYEGDVLMNGTIRYERKQTGPFKGILVSQPFLIQIDGEDYVEYRVLTKPSF